MIAKSPFTDAKVVACGVSPDDYHQDPSLRGTPDFVMSRSELCSFSHCPARWRNGYERPESAALRNGSLIDILALTPKRFETEYVVIPETYPAPETHAKVKKGEIAIGDPLPWNANSNFCAAWEEKHAGRTLVKHKALEEAQTAISRLKAEMDIWELIQAAQTQVLLTATYKDAETGISVPLKILIDLVPLATGPCGNSLVDFKTTRSAAYRPWCKDVFAHNYHVQAALYLDIYCAATGEKRETFCHIVQENVAPFHVERRMLTSEYIEIGRSTYISALGFYCQCLKKNEWPGYYCRDEINGWQMVAPEPWMVMSDPTMFRMISIADPLPDPEWMQDEAKAI